jgi:hypothetical protein
MQRRRFNISAALAIAIERQVEDIIASAKAQCAQRDRVSPQRKPRKPPAAFERLTADDARALDAAAALFMASPELGDALRPGSDSRGSQAPSLEPGSARRSFFWKRLHSLFTAGDRSPSRGARRD